MTIQMSFLRAGIKDEQEGAWFRGRIYGMQRARTQFLTFPEIREQLASDANRANDPAGRFTYFPKGVKNPEKALSFPTAELSKALDHALSENFAMKVQFVRASKSIGEDVVQMTNGYKTTQFPMEFLTGVLAGHERDAMNPTKLKYYFLGMADPTTIYAGHDLMQAKAALQEGAVHHAQSANVGHHP